MTKCITSPALFPRCKGRQITANFEGGDITSDAGVLLLRQLDRELGLIQSVASKIDDPRNQQQCTHGTEQVIRQRVFSVALGHEDLNDHQQLRHDLALQTAVGTDGLLASQSTLCRFELQATKQWAVAMHEEIVERFIRSYKKPPKRLILDFDATDDLVHGTQEGRHYNGYYNNYCFLPLYVFCGQKLLVSYLRPASVDAAKHTGAILKLLVKRIRQAWPSVNIIFRGDGGFCRPRVLAWCERHDVGYIVGLGKNSRLEALSLNTRYRSATQFDQTRIKQRHFATLRYQAKSWKTERKVVVKAEFSRLGDNTRYVVTNLKGAAKWLYDRRYCLRGDMENRIKEQQLGLFADRTSCHQWWPNQYRLLLSSLAYVLMEHLRSGYLRGTKYAHAQMTTLRLKLLKIGAVVTRNTRSIKLLMSSAYPDQELYLRIAKKLVPG